MFHASRERLCCNVEAIFDKMHYVLDRRGGLKKTVKFISFCISAPTSQFAVARRQVLHARDVASEADPAVDAEGPVGGRAGRVPDAQRGCQTGRGGNDLPGNLTD